jgi:hypothetical protein
MIFGALSAILWFVLFLMAHIIIFSFCPNARRAKVILYLLAFILLGEIASSGIAFFYLPDSNYLIREGILMAVIWGCLTILCLFVLYMPFYYVVATSLSVESLILINNRQQGQYSVAQLQEIFVSKSLVSDRLETMVLNGWLARCGDDYMLTVKGRFIAKYFRFIKKLWNLGLGG